MTFTCNQWQNRVAPQTTLIVVAGEGRDGVISEVIPWSGQNQDRLSVSYKATVVTVTGKLVTTVTCQTADKLAMSSAKRVRLWLIESGPAAGMRQLTRVHLSRSCRLISSERNSFVDALTETNESTSSASLSWRFVNRFRRMRTKLSW